MNATASSFKRDAAAALPEESPVELVVRRHLRFGWLALLFFLSLGLVLEAMHGFKVQAYLNLLNETRRLMWTLAHAHGTLLAVVNLGFALTTLLTPGWSERKRSAASWLLIAASMLMPGGFFLGGIWVYAGDPGLGILLVPLGGILLFAAVLLTAFAVKHFDQGVLGGKGRR